jgi:hypothetical protein
MRKLGIVFGLALAMAAATPIVAADKSIDYHGTFDHATNAFCGGEAAVVTGKWNVSLKHDGTASVDIVAFWSRGVLHASWGGNALKAPWIQQPATADGFNLVASDVFGSTELSFVLDDHGVLTFTIDPRCEDGSPASLVGAVVH